MRLIFVAVSLIIAGWLGFRILTGKGTEDIMIAPPEWLKTNDVTYSKSLLWTNGSASLLMIFPHSAIEEEIKPLQELAENDRRAVLKLSEFLDLKKEFDGATCLRQHPSTQNRRDEHETGDESKTAGKISLQSSWCQFIIRNTGPVLKVKLRKHFRNKSVAENSFYEEEILLQICNILQGPFVVRKKYL